MKKKKPKIVEENLVPFNGVVYNCKIVNYKEDGSIISISNETESELFLEIETSLIPNFMKGSKDFRFYNIDYFKKIKDKLITDTDDLDTFVKSDYVYSVIEQNTNSEILIKNDFVNKKWIVTLSNSINQEFLEDFYFYSVLKNNKSFVLGSYYGKRSDFLNNTIEFNFSSELESDINSILLLTNNKKRYSLESLI